MNRLAKLSLGEIFFLQLSLWLLVWLVNDNVATLLTLCIGAVVSAVLVVSLLSEAIEPSKVPKRYFSIMAISILTMVLAAGVYVLILGGRLEFLEPK